MTGAGVDLGRALTRIVVADAATREISGEQPWPTPFDSGGNGREHVDWGRAAAVLHEQLTAAGVTSVAMVMPGATDAPPVSELIPDLADGPPRLLPSSQVALAALLRAGQPGWGTFDQVVVADLGAGHTEFSLCDLTNGQPVIRESAGAGPLAPDLDVFWALAARAKPDAAPAERSALAQQMAGLPDEVFRRADQAMHASIGRPHFRSTPVYDSDSLQAGAAVELLGGVAAHVTEVAAQLAQLDPAASLVPVLFLGGGSAIGRLRAGALRGLGHADPDNATVLPLRPDERTFAAARGAALVAAGRLTLASPPAHTLAVEVNQWIGHQVKTWLLPLDQGDAVDPRDGSPACVDVPTGTGGLKLWLRSAGGSAFAELPEVSAELPQGRYRIGLQTDGAVRPTAVLFTPAAGGPAVRVPLGELGNLASHSGRRS